MVLLFHHQDFLLDAVFREHHGHLLGIRVSREALCYGLLAVDDDKAPLGISISPDAFLVGLVGHYQAENDCEGDEEDAGGGIGASILGSPGVGVEGGSDVGLEGHDHAHAHGGAAGVGAARWAVHAVHAVHDDIFCCWRVLFFFLSFGGCVLLEGGEAGVK